MKRIFAMLMSILLAGLTACGSGPDRAQTSQRETSAEDMPAASAQAVSSDGDSGRVLIAYFTVPEQVDTTGVDAVAGASVVVKGSEVLGNTEYVAKVIQDAIGGDLFRIETEADYPLDHEPLVDQASQEQNDNLRPVLKTHIENPEQYDTIILGFPNWWADMPQPLYTFLEQYDFSGKTIIPFVTHGGSGFSGTRNTISELQSGAVVSDNTLSLSRNDVAEAEREIQQWVESLGLQALEG